MNLRSCWMMVIGLSDDLNLITKHKLRNFQYIASFTSGPDGGGGGGISLSVVAGNSGSASLGAGVSQTVSAGSCGGVQLGSWASSYQVSNFWDLADFVGEDTTLKARFKDLLGLSLGSTPAG